MKNKFYFFSIAVLALASCNKKDDVIDPTPNVVVPTVEKAVVKPEVGGPNEPNQVFIDLATNTQKAIKRDSWDFGFYSGDDFRVILNSSLKMAAKQLETTNIDEVQTADESVAVGFQTLAKLGYVDYPAGLLKSADNTPGRGTAIAEISATDSENKVYLINMGSAISTIEPAAGSTNLEGEKRGWKKIRITRSTDGKGYVIQYANLEDTTHKTITVNKNSEYNFVFLSLTTEQTIEVQPKKTAWDLCFTPLTNYTSTAQPATDENTVTYYFADMVLNNIHGNTSVLRITKDKDGNDFADVTKRDATYDSFNKASITTQDTQLFTDNLVTQLMIGASWRSTFTRVINDKVFYVVKDAEGNLFKLRFLALVNESGVRGYPVFEYELLK
ncbi:MAG: HmuY family protein [Capnocytophaga sp.]|nr:HmuY family protein [Capnocytophaga sp.]